MIITERYVIYHEFWINFSRLAGSIAFLPKMCINQRNELLGEGFSEERQKASVSPVSNIVHSMGRMILTESVYIGILMSMIRVITITYLTT